MAIKLRVISDHYQNLGEERSRVFGVNGGTIGRATDNDWVLPDPDRIVSGHHCRIEYRSGSYWLNDSSTNGVFVNSSRKPVSADGPVPLNDGDRLQIGDYEMVVSVDDRIDFLPENGEAESSADHLDSHIGADLDLDGLLSSRDTDQSGSISIRNAYGIKVSPEFRGADDEELPEDEPPPPPMRIASSTREPSLPPVRTAPGSREPSPPPMRTAATANEAPPPPDWATRTQPITREELADAIARRQGRLEARKQSVPVHRKAATWTDLQSAVQAFCRGAGIDPSSLSTASQEMLPLLAGQMLREMVVGLRDVLQTLRRSDRADQKPGSTASNPLRSGSSSVEQTLLQLLESHGRIYGGAVDSLREVLLDIKEHEQATAKALPTGVQAVVEQLDPQRVMDQIRNGRATKSAAGDDPRARYWEHYAELYRVLTQNVGKELPHSFKEGFSRKYLETRSELGTRRKRSD